MEEAVLGADKDVMERAVLGGVRGLSNGGVEGVETEDLPLPEEVLLGCANRECGGVFGRSRESISEKAICFAEFSLEDAGALVAIFTEFVSTFGTGCFL